MEEEFKWTGLLDLLVRVLKKVESQDIKKDVSTALFLTCIILITATVLVLSLVIYGPKLLKFSGRARKDDNTSENQTRATGNNYSF